MMRVLFLLALLMGSAPAFAVTVQEVEGEKSGVKAWLVEDHRLPILAVHMAFAGGSEQDPADKQGLAALAMDSLTEGAGPYDAAAFQRELALRSISMGFEAGRDELSGAMKCLSADKDKAFALLHDALARPQLAARDVDRLRAAQRAAVRQQMADPGWQARYALFSEIFAGHPYAQRRLGTMQTLDALTVADLRDFIGRHIARDNAVVAVAGDITPQALAAALDAVFADLPAHAQLAPVADVAETADVPPLLVRREGTQTAFLVAMPGPRRGDRDWYAAEIANYILGGGGFSSRLMQEVRDKRGLTYGISTALAPSEHDGLILGQADVDNPKAAEAVQTIRDTMRRFHDEGPTPREVAAAKDYLTGAQPLALTSTDKIAAMLVAIQRDRLGINYLDRYADNVRGVSDRDIARVVDRWFDPSKLVWVMAGKPEGLAASMKEMQVKDRVRQ